MVRLPKRGEASLRWWWMAAAVLVLPGVVVAIPAWAFLLRPCRNRGRLPEVGLIGGLPRTPWGTRYGRSPVFRCAVWAMLLLGWYFTLYVLGRNQAAGLMNALAWFPWGIGWWWHFERVAGLRRLARWMTGQSNGGNTVVPSAISPGPVRPDAVSGPAGSGPGPSWTGGGTGPVPLSALPPLLVTTTNVPDAERLTAPHPRSTIPAPGSVHPTRFGAEDLRSRRPGVCARTKAAEEEAAGASAHVVANWARGAEGEEIVGRVLDKGCPTGWTVIHDVPVGNRGANIDHVVIGPAGVFVLNTKHHRGADVELDGPRVLVRGHLQDYVVKARTEADRASGALTRALGYRVIVQPLLVFVNARDIKTVGQAPFVEVATPATLWRTLTAHGAAMPVWRIHEVVEAAVRPRTWAASNWNAGSLRPAAGYAGAPGPFQPGRPTPSRKPRDRGARLLLGALTVVAVGVVLWAVSVWMTALAAVGQ